MLLAHAHVDRIARRIDRQVLVPQPPHQVERLAGRLFAGQAQCVLLHLLLQRRAHVTGGAEEAIGRGQPLDALVWSLEVVVLHEQSHPALAVLEVGKDRPREQLLPQRLPEALDLPAGLRVVRAALHVRDAVAAQFGLKLGLPAPGGVLAPLVGEDLPRRPVLGNPARERLHHQETSLVMGHRQAHQVARVIVQECRHVHPLVLAQQEREQIRLPQLVGLGALEALRHLGSGPGSRLGLGQRRWPRLLLLQHSPDGPLGGANPQEPSHHIADATAARPRLLRVRLAHRFAQHLLLHRSLCLRHAARMILQALLSALAVLLHPVQRRLIRHP